MIKAEKVIRDAQAELNGGFTGHPSDISTELQAVVAVLVDEFNDAISAIQKKTLRRG